MLKRLSDLDEEALFAAYAPPRNPWLRVNFVSSADGAATVDGLSGGLSGHEDKRVFKMLRARCDVLLTGMGTVEAEAYGALLLSPERRQWRLDQGLPEFPVMAVASNSARLDPHSSLIRDAPRKPVLVCAADAPAERIAALRNVVDVIAVGEGSIDYPAAVEGLHELGHLQVLSEGGPHVFGELLRAGLVDELDVTYSPLLVGSGPTRIAGGPEGLEKTQEMTLAHALEAGGNLIARYVRA